MIPIVPALIPVSADEVRAVLPKLQFSPEIHIDVVDGVFVQATSWPYSPKGHSTEVRAVTDTFTLEVDLMVSDPLSAAKEWLASGADMLVFHIETITVEDLKRFIATTKISIGVCAANDTPLEQLFPYLEIADYIQIMGIAHIGSQGQQFDERVLERLHILKGKFPNHPVTVDGSVNTETIAKLVGARADRFICGSAITKAADPFLAYCELRALTN